MSPATPMFQDIRIPRKEEPNRQDVDQEAVKSVGEAQRKRNIHITPPKDDGLSDDDISPSIIEVLRYIKRVFEDEAFLDELPLDAAGNPGAWHAWRAHRKKSKYNESERPSNGWNWDGVWAERVKKGVSGSLSEAVLFGEGDDLIRFLDMDDESVDSIRKDLSSK